MITPEDVIGRAAAAWVSSREGVLSGTSRTAHHARARRLAMALVRELFVLSYASLGVLFHRDHGTIIHQVTRMEQFLRPGVSRADWLAEARVYRALLAELRPQLEPQPLSPAGGHPAASPSA